LEQKSCRGQIAKIPRSGSGGVSSPQLQQAGEADGWGQRRGRGAGVAKLTCKHERRSTPGAFQEEVVTMGRRRRARAMEKEPGRAGVCTRCASSARTWRRWGRPLEVAGELAGVKACGRNVRPHGEHGNQEANQGEMRTRRCAGVPGSSKRGRCGRRRSTMAGIGAGARRRRGRIGENKEERGRLGSIPCSMR
jgi:hypothetical protein